MSEAATLRVELADTSREPFLRRVTIRNYKSVAACDVRLGRLTFLVGRNGSGKSNFLDALRLVVESLAGTLDHAIRARGGIDAVRRRSTGHPRNFSIRLEFRLGDEQLVQYSFEITSKPNSGFAVKSEILRIIGVRNEVIDEYQVQDGAVRSSVANMPPVAKDRLYLVVAAGRPEFRRAYDALGAMGFYNINPIAMKTPQSPDADELLRHDGSNVASVIARLTRDRPQQFDRLKGYLRTIAPGIVDVRHVTLGPSETIQFGQELQGSKYPWKFFASNMSDGTLRALGMLLAVTQLAGNGRHVRLVGIEEPETALHPAAAGALMDALREAATHTQVLATSHSPELLDNLLLDETAESDTLLAVQAAQGRTEIGPVDPVSRRAIRDHLFTPGDLLRMDQLTVDPENLRQQMTLFPEV